MSPAHISPHCSPPGHGGDREQGGAGAGGGEQGGGGLHQRGQQTPGRHHLVDRQRQARSVSRSHVSCQAKISSSFRVVAQ